MYLRLIPKPHTYPKQDDEDRTHSIIDNYDEETVEAMIQQNEEMINDSTENVDQE